MTQKEVDESYDIVWSGGEGLIPDRVTKVTGFWTAPKRLYNRTGKHARKPGLDNPVTNPQDAVSPEKTEETVDLENPYGE